MDDDVQRNETLEDRRSVPPTRDLLVTLATRTYPSNAGIEAPEAEEDDDRKERLMRQDDLATLVRLHSLRTRLQINT
jgi:hypothetical protein